MSACLCVMLAGCDDFLDTESLTMKDTSNFPVNETDATQMVNGIYSVMNRTWLTRRKTPSSFSISLPTTVWEVEARATSVHRAWTD